MDYDYYEDLKRYTDQFEMKELLGRGAFATVIRAIDRRT